MTNSPLSIICDGHNMKILITGGLGFIGHNVANILESLGHDIVIVDNKSTYGIIPQAELDTIINERLTKIKTKNIIIDAIECVNNSVFANVDLVIHLASFPRQKVVNQNPQLGSRVMSEGLLNLLELSKKNNVKRFVYISSSMVYGDFNTLDGVVESAICNPIGQYSIMKLAGEWLVQDYYRSSRLNYTIIRPSAVYGPLDVEDRVVSKFLLSAMRSATLNVNGINDELDFSYVDDVALGIAMASISTNTLNNIYNISRGESHSLLSAANLAIQVVGQGQLNIRDRENNYPHRGRLNITKAVRDFNYYPKTNIFDGFVKYHQWLKNTQGNK